MCFEHLKIDPSFFLQLYPYSDESILESVQIFRIILITHLILSISTKPHKTKHDRIKIQTRSLFSFNKTQKFLLNSTLSKKCLVSYALASLESPQIYIECK